MKKLIKGLHKFQTEVFPIQKDFFQNLAKGQNPEILFITCSDSRINPNLVTSAEPGDLFILRNAGNIIPLYTIQSSEAATIEFAVKQLKVKHIIICGHSYCGAVEAVRNLDALRDMPALYSWISTNISPTLAFVQNNYQPADDATLANVLLQEHVLKQIENLKTHPAVAQAISQNELSVHAWIYKFEQGDIFSYNIQEGQFERIKHF